MAESDDVCWLTVKPGGEIELRHAGKEYHSRIHEDRRSLRIVERMDRLAKEHAAACQSGDLTLLGDTLFDMLFGEQARQVLVDDGGKRTISALDVTLGEVFLRLHGEHRKRRGPSRLRLSLAFEHNADRWANLPWEFLHASPDKGDGFFIAGEGSLSLTRIIEPLSERTQPRGPLHVLVVLAQPRELKFRMEEKLWTNLLSSLRRQLRLSDTAGATDNPETLFEPTWAMLTARLGDITKPAPDVIHFICHGRFKDGNSEIALHRPEAALNNARKIDPQNEPPDDEWQKVDTLKQHLKARPPWLCFMETCDSARSEGEYGPSRSAAQQIAQADVPFVVAMQYRITADDAKEFRDAFYQQLGNGMSVDDAVMLGREVLGKIDQPYGHPRFATPVIYLRSEHRILLPPKPDGAVAEAQSGWQCPDNCGKMIFARQKRCPCKKYDLTYCTVGHPNKAGVAECETYGCDAPILGAPAVAAPLPAASTPLPPSAPPDAHAIADPA